MSSSNAVQAVVLIVFLSCCWQFADAAEATNSFLYGRAMSDTRDLPSRSSDPYLWDLGEEEPLPDYIVRRYIQPLVWVKIPKGFAGTWETRHWSHLVVISNDSDTSQSTETNETTIIRNGKVRHHSIETHENNVSSKHGNVKDLPESWAEADEYRFVRGMQMDENGDIWDCPSIRNVQFHQSGDETSFHQWVELYSNESSKIVSDTMISESIIRENNSELESIRNKTPIERRLISDSQVEQTHTDYLPTERWIKHIIEYKIADFKPLDYWRGIDLKASFDEFRKRPLKSS
jgi:hypothetical protein